MELYTETLKKIVLEDLGARESHTITNCPDRKPEIDIHIEVSELDGLVDQYDLKEDRIVEIKEFLYNELQGGVRELVQNHILAHGDVDKTLDSCAIQESADPEICFRFTIKPIKRIRHRERDSEGKFTPTSTGIMTRRIRIDEDLYNQLSRIKDELLARKKLRVPEKDILNVILAEELTTYSEEDFNNLLENVWFLIEKWS